MLYRDHNGGLVTAASLMNIYFEYILSGICVKVYMTVFTGVYSIVSH